MSTKAEHYAEALLELSRNRNAEEIDILLEHLELLLKRKHLTPLFHKIMRSLETAQEKKRDRILIRTVKALSKEAREAILQKYFKDLPHHEIHQEIDETLIGGYQLETKDLRIDNSYKKSLLNLYKSMTTNK